MVYVYRYIHPDHPWLYVGKTDNLPNRIRSHDTQEKDNIDRKYESLLRESVVYYIEVDNEAQATYIEAFLIDKHSPLLNKQGVRRDGSLCSVDMILPQWKKYIRNYDLDDFDYPQRSLVQKLKQDILDAEEDMQKLKQKRERIRKATAKGYEELAKKQAILKEAKDLQVIAPNISASESIPYTVGEIQDIYEAFPNSDMVFNLYVCNPLGDYITYKITREGLYIDDQFQIERSDSLFGFRAFHYTTKINSYTSSAVGLYILFDYYTEQINFLESIKKTAKFKDVLSQKIYGKWENEDSFLYIFIENNEIFRVDIGEESFNGADLTDTHIQDMIEKYGEIDVCYFETTRLCSCDMARRNYSMYKEKLEEISIRIEKLQNCKENTDDYSKQSQRKESIGK